jgi:pimeloyl-ACP methyl ester carboxylesterase
MLFGARTLPDDHPAFANLPIRRITVGTAKEHMAVHVAGQLLIGRAPIVCVPGYQRNMADFADFIGLFHRVMGEDWPVVLIDLKGRGRSADRGDKAQYISTVDAADIAQVCAALT